MLLVSKYEIGDTVNILIVAGVYMQHLAIRPHVIVAKEYKLITAPDVYEWYYTLVHQAEEVQYVLNMDNDPDTYVPIETLHRWESELP